MLLFLKGISPSHVAKFSFKKFSLFSKIIYNVIFTQKIIIFLSLFIVVLGKGWGCKKSGGN